MHSHNSPALPAPLTRAGWLALALALACQPERGTTPETDSEDPPASSSDASTGTTVSPTTDAVTTTSSDTDSATTSGDASTTSGDDTTTTTTTDTAASTTSGDATTTAAQCEIPTPEQQPCTAPGGDPEAACDIYTQNCPAGEKCTPYATDGSKWNAVKCVPLAGTPKQIGEPCTAPGGGSDGDDDCAAGAMCWSVQNEVGHCIELCGCSPETPSCATPQTICAIANQGVLPLCLSVCDPLASECPDNEVCAPGPNGSPLFFCIVDASAGAGPGDPCKFNNSCSPGSACVPAAMVQGCAADRCCTAHCTLGDDGPCADDQSCVSWYGEDEPTECLESVGVCAL